MAQSPNGSRVSNFFRSPQFTQANAPLEGEPSEISHPPGLQSPIPVRPGVESAILGTSFTSGSSQTPARSYFHHYQQGPQGALGPTHITSREIREDTAELASWALSDAESLRSETPLLNRIGQLESENARGAGIVSLEHDESESAYTSNQVLHIPKVILEISEVRSPDEESRNYQSSRTSVLATLLRNSSSETRRLEASNAVDAESDDEALGSVTVRNGIISQPDEHTSLLQRQELLRSYGDGPDDAVRDIEGQKRLIGSRIQRVKQSMAPVKEWSATLARTVIEPRSWNPHAIWRHVVLEPVGYLPAVVLGLLLNILDALSYGMILFPLGQKVFENMGPDGISMFYLSCIISQLVYSCGGSIFRGGVGSEMIEVVPFFHQMAFKILAEVGEENPRAVIATTITAYAASAVLTGAVFYIMGQCRLGTLIGFFPRHILIGCIGGIGFFLVATGVEVSARLNSNLEYNLVTLKKLMEMDTLPLWTVPLALSIGLIVVKRWIKRPWAEAAYFMAIIAGFYIFVEAIPDLNLPDLRNNGWVFEAPAAGEPWYHFYTYYDLNLIHWEAVANTIPAMFALTFFGVLHVPINVPALGVTAGEDNVDLDRELRAHGVSNALSGFCGSIQNYLVYTNTVLFLRSGGDSRVAGIMLAAATMGVMFIGPVTIGYVPIMVVGALIFFLGFELMKEALIDTWGRVHRVEYITIVIIVVTMGAYDFVIGIVVGIVLACMSFVLKTSTIHAIRTALPGGVASSTVRRHPIHHHFLQAVGKQIYVMKLAGHLFFGTIAGVENAIRARLHDDAFQSQPIQMLVIDLSKVDGLDYSAAEAFPRINRILRRRNVRLIMCGFSDASETGKSLYNVGLRNGEECISIFDDLNSALEYCENVLLKAFHERRDDLDRTYQPSLRFIEVPQASPSAVSAVSAASDESSSFYGSPRRGQLHHFARTTLQEHRDSSKQHKWQRYKQPLQLILHAFSTVSDKDEDFWILAVPLFERRVFNQGDVLYTRGEAANAFYLLESGILRAEYKLPQGTFSEAIVAGTCCGELPFFSNTSRTSTTWAERDCVTWVLNNERWDEAQTKQATLAQELLKISLKLTSERMDATIKYMLLTSG